MAKKPKSSKKPVDDLTKATKKTDVELKEDELGRATGGVPLSIKFDKNG